MDEQQGLAMAAPNLPSASPPASPSFDPRLDFGVDDMDCLLLLPSPSPLRSPPPPPSPSPSPSLRHRRCLFSDPSPLPPSLPSKSKKRGTYNCGKCGLPKRGHVCPGDDLPPSSPSPQHSAVKRRHQPLKSSPDFDHPLAGFASSSLSDQQHLDRRHGACIMKERSPAYSLPPASASSSTTSSCSSNERHKRARVEFVDPCYAADADLSFSTDSNHATESLCPEQEDAMPLSCLVQILSRLLPLDLVAAGSVCRRWRQCAEYVWAAVRQIHLNVSGNQDGSEPCSADLLPFVLRRSPSLNDLTLSLSGYATDSLLESIIATSPHLASLEVYLAPGGVNGITGKGLRNLLRHGKSLASVKLEGCRNLLEVELASPCLDTLWLTGCSGLKYMFLNCSGLLEVCLDFMPSGDYACSRETDSLPAILKNMGSTAKGLKRLHVASQSLDDRAVSALLSSKLKSLRMLSLTFGAGITDDSIATIANSCQRLELLDLSGSSITDKALQMISDSFSSTLTRLLLALCPNVSCHGLETVASQLPQLKLLDCGKVMVDKCHAAGHASVQTDDDMHATDEDPTSAELRIHHPQLEKLSLWGCSGLQVLILDCPKLVDLNLTGCSKLSADGFLLHCPSLKDLHVGNCRKELVEEIRNLMERAISDPKVIWRRQADGSKRVQAPCIS